MASLPFSHPPHLPGCQALAVLRPLPLSLRDKESFSSMTLRQLTLSKGKGLPTRGYSPSPIGSPWRTALALRAWVWGGEKEVVFASKNCSHFYSVLVRTNASLLFPCKVCPKCFLHHSIIWWVGILSRNKNDTYLSSKNQLLWLLFHHPSPMPYL